jgi:Na+/H+ antiporter NhaC
VDKFWELLKESVILQAVLALLFACAVCYLYVTGQEVPQELTSLLGIIIGFYFGSKVQGQVNESKSLNLGTTTHYAQERARDGEKDSGSHFL